jgi:exopolyphosphatase / guanosine-5'-triphosphate,3'-diphosphate pyrophosphatase
MRLAAIDIGTNSIHMIVVEVRPDSSFEVIDREKEMVRLGAGGLDGGSLAEPTMDAAIQTLVRFRRLAEANGVDEIIASATSAVREARNGGEFLAAAIEQAGIRPRVLSGPEEARLIHRAAVYGVDLKSTSAVVIDIGGGSTEVTLGSVSGARLARSFKLGAIRLTERFVQSDPIAPADERKLVRYVTSEAGSFLKDLRARGFGRIIGTSGTILAIGSIALVDERVSGPGDLHHRTIPVRRIHQLRKTITRMDLEQRLRLPGLDPQRADLIVAGAILLDEVLARLGAEELTLCTFALREGLVLDYISRHHQQIVRAERYPDIRRRSVLDLAERCHYDAVHAQHVARMALTLFDHSRSWHGLADRARDWLEYAALLHDVGYHISYLRHQRHSYYLIKHGGLRGFEPDEVEIMALVAGFHRRGTVKKGHVGFKALSRADRVAVRTLAAMLRLAESLDRGHTLAVRTIRLDDRGDQYVLRLNGRADTELAVWAAGRHLTPLEAVLGKEIRLEPGLSHHAQHAEHASSVPRQAVRGRRDRRVGKDHPA